MSPQISDRNSNDDEFRASMVQYIKTHFADVLGEDVKLLELDGGLELIRDKYMHILNDKAA